MVLSPHLRLWFPMFARGARRVFRRTVRAVNMFDLLFEKTDVLPTLRFSTPGLLSVNLCAAWYAARFLQG